MGFLFDANRILKPGEALGEIPSNRSLLRRLVTIALPSTAEAVLVALVGFVDTIMVSSLGEEAITAVGLTTQPRMVFVSFYWAVSFATSAIVARRHGENDRENANRTLKCALIITVVLGLLFGALAILLGRDAMLLMGAKADTIDASTDYLRIVIGCCIFSAITMTMNAAQRGIGNTKITLRTNLVSNIVNICFNYLLIGGKLGFPALGVRGAAIATVLGTVVSCIMSTLSLMPKDNYVSLRYRLEERIFNRLTTNAIWKIASGALGERLVIRVGFILFARIIADIGTQDFALYQIGMNVMTLSFSFADGISTADVTLVGYSLGQRRPDIARVFVLFCQRIGLIISVILSIIYIFFGRQIYSLFVDDPMLLDSGQQIMWVMCVIVMLQISSVIFSSTLRAAGDTRFTSIISWSTLIRPVVCWIMCVWLGFGIFGAFIGIAVDQLLRLILVYLRFRSGKWKAHVV